MILFPPQGCQFVYWEDWGEALTNKSTPVLCVLNIWSGNVSVLHGIPEHISPGEAIWAPEDAGIIFVGRWHVPWRLGLKYCTNRKSALYCVDLTGNEYLEISSGINSVHSPRLSPDQHHLIFLEGGSVKTHHQCYGLSLYNLDKKVTSTVVRILDYPAPGLQKTAGEWTPPILIGDAEVESVSSFKLLGVHIIEDLSWTLHTDTIPKKAC